ncbi:MAG TPA: hypothetical protein VHT74_15215 [Acetobacteraceae bacterium]|jgi:hypothetical protein|nr:hypothetical protein [Acetobacteraceae bacterium]
MRIPTRNILLAGIATLGTGGLAGAAFAQTPTAPAQPTTPPMEGQFAYPAASPPSFVNDNNNYQATPFKGPVANPTPGTIVIHLNGKVEVQAQAAWTSADQRVATAPAAGSLGSVLGNNGSGPVKLAPQALDSYARLYFGADGMASNGLRYGAAIELRQNFSGQISNNGSSGASGNSSLETIFVRRAFTYLAGEDWGIVRLGQADGVISIFDNGITTFQFLPTSNLEGGDLESNIPQNAVVPWYFVSQSGNEYGYSKAVYLSPQIAGFDFGVQYAPNTSNGFGLSGSNNALNGSITGSGTGTGLGCTVANSGCPTLSAGPGIQDGSRVLNLTTVGVRYQGLLGNVSVLAYGAYGISGTADYTGSTAPAVLGNTGTLASSRFNGKYDGLSFGNAGVALTYAGFTLGGNFIGGRTNGPLAAAPENGAGELAYTLGLKYVRGPLVMGIVGEIGWSQGNVNLSGISQRRGRGIDLGASYVVAPGLTVYGEYFYQDLQQSAFNFISNTAGGASGNLNNSIRSQGITFGNVVSF